jgi:hypothetical protein
VHDASLEARDGEARRLALDGQALDRRAQEPSWSLQVSLRFQLRRHIVSQSPKSLKSRMALS